MKSEHCSEILKVFPLLSLFTDDTLLYVGNPRNSSTQTNKKTKTPKSKKQTCLC